MRSGLMKGTLQMVQRLWTTVSEEDDDDVHHFRADPELSTPENGLSNANWTSHRPNVFINKSLNVKTEFLT